MKILLCYGNEFLKEDSLAAEIADSIKIPGFLVIKSCRVDDVLQYPGSEMFIVDVVENLKNVRFITIDELEAGTISTLHDFDLGFFLSLISKLQKLDIKIIGIPMQGDKESISAEVTKLIT